MQLKPRRSTARSFPSNGRSLAYDPRVTLGVLGFLAFCEAIVAFVFSMPLGIGLGVGTGALVVLGKVRERAASKRKAPLISLEDSDHAALYADPETGLPNRNHLIDQITREIARAERYMYDLTLAVVEIERLDDLEATWGPEITGKSIVHTNQTLKRVTRASDFLARVDEHRFALVLMQCNGEQAKKLGERIEIAVANRPIRSGSRMRGVPVYLTAKVTSLQYDKTRLRGPLDFLSRAGGEVVVQPEPKVVGPAQAPVSRQLSRADAPSLRRELVKDYYPDGEIKDFADAYEQYRSHKAG
ncbi:MAG TPA: diguanylate cyclase [Tepidiformaceae bacterium]|nr:diguanylate cyclase [Tepidiformaceae bacterium]